MTVWTIWAVLVWLTLTRLSRHPFTSCTPHSTHWPPGAISPCAREGRRPAAPSASGQHQPLQRHASASRALGGTPLHVPCWPAGVEGEGDRVRYSPLHTPHTCLPASPAPTSLTTPRTPRTLPHLTLFHTTPHHRRSHRTHTAHTLTLHTLPLTPHHTTYRVLRYHAIPALRTAGRATAWAGDGSRCSRRYDISV